MSILITAQKRLERGMRQLESTSPCHILALATSISVSLKWPPFQPESSGKPVHSASIPKINHLHHIVVLKISVL